MEEILQLKKPAKQRNVDYYNLSQFCKTLNKKELNKYLTSLDYEVVKILLENGADPNTKYNGLPVIFWAAKEDMDGIVRLLIDYKAKKDPSAIEACIIYDHSDMLDLLLQNNFKPIPAHVIMAISYHLLKWNYENSFSMIETLLKTGVNFDLKSIKHELESPSFIKIDYETRARVIDLLTQYDWKNNKGTKILKGISDFLGGWNSSMRDLAATKIVFDM